MESLISSRIMYALPVWGPPLLSYQVGRLQHMQNRAVRVVFSLKKFDHVSIPREQLGWPDVSDEIKICSLAAFHHHCFSRQCLLPITFGHSHIYDTPDVRPILLTPFIIIWQEHNTIFDI